MSDKYKATDPDKAYFITTTIVDWIDLFTRKRYKDLIVESLKYCQENKGLVIYAWCLMPSHLHMICNSESELSISEIMRDFKRHTSKKLIESINSGPESRKEWLLERFTKACEGLKRAQNSKVWRNGYHAKELYGNKFIHQKLEYVHANPVSDGIVEFAEEYIYCSAPLYSGKEGRLDCVCLPQRMQTI